MVKVGIVGYGIIGQSHAHHFIEGRIKGACISAVCNRGIERRELAASDLGRSLALNGKKIGIFDSYKTMLDSKLVDAIIISTPHLNHEEVALYAFEKGIHVLVEKPLGSYTLQAVRMNKAALQSKSVYSAMFNQRSIPVFLKMKKVLDNNGIGELKRFSWIATDAYRPESYFALNEWRGTWEFDGGGILLNQAPHQLDMWAWLVGMPKSIRANCHFGSQRDINVEDDVSAYFEYENGATGIFVSSTHECPGTNRLEISGTHGRLVMESVVDNTTLKASKQLTYDKYDVDERVFNKSSGESENEDRYTFKYGYQREVFKGADLANAAGFSKEQHANIINDFIDSINNNTPLLCPGEEGLNSLKLANAMYLSEWTNSEIDLDNFDDELYYEKYLAQVEKEKQNI